MLLPNIEWLTENDIWEAISSLQAQYREDPICVINASPLGYILNLKGLSYLYDDNPLRIAAAKIRTVIKGHPLLDGNKRLGMLLGSQLPHEAQRHREIHNLGPKEGIVRDAP